MQIYRQSIEERSSSSRSSRSSRTSRIGSLTSSSNDIQDNMENNNNRCRIAKSKEQLIGLYQIGQYVCILVGTILLLMPDRTNTVLLAKKFASGIGFGIAGGLCYILKGACIYDRLNSDTYKRLNLGLFFFFLFGCTAIPGEAGFLKQYNHVVLLTILLTLVKVFGVGISFLGWTRGVVPQSTTTFATASEYMNEIKNGFKETINGIIKTSKKGLSYRNCLLLVLFGLVSNLMEGIFYIRYRTAIYQRPFTWFDISLQWSSCSRLLLLSTIIFSLKDAAERDRLSGTTFIQLNVFIGIWATITAIGQTISLNGIAVDRGILMFSFSFPFFIKALKSQIEKERKKKK